MDAAISLDQALALTRTGDIWIFRGRSGPDRAIQTLTNRPVNHVGMSLVIEDMPPLMWHAELGKSLPDLWSGRCVATAPQPTPARPRRSTRGRVDREARSDRGPLAIGAPSGTLSDARRD